MKKNSIKKTIVVLVLVMGLCAVLFTGTSAYGGIESTRWNNYIHNSKIIHTT